MIAKLLVPVAVGALIAAPGTTIDVLQAGKAQVAKVKRQTELAILLPAELPLAGRVPKLYVTGSGSRDRWSLEFAGAPRCGGADACLVASFEGRRGARLPGPPNVLLPNGGRALYQPITCGASCAPATLSFVHRGTLYTWQVKDPPPKTKTVFARLAGDAIAAGPR